MDIIKFLVTTFQNLWPEWADSQADKADKYDYNYNLSAYTAVRNSILDQIIDSKLNLGHLVALSVNHRELVSNNNFSSSRDNWVFMVLGGERWSEEGRGSLGAWEPGSGLDRRMEEM